MKHRGDRKPENGFSLVELLVVAGLIAVMAAVAIPALMGFLRVYQIRAATQELASEIQAARNKAIRKNVNLGVAVVVQDATNYWIHIEDDQSLPRAAARQTLNTAAPDPVQSVRRTLPGGVEFALTGANCPSLAAFAPANSGLRFNRLGAWCDPATGDPACPDVLIAGASVNAIQANAATGSILCLVERRTSLSRTVTVVPGGRVMAQP